MAKRFHISFSSFNGETLAAEIHDTDFTGTSIEVNGRREGFTIDYQGNFFQDLPIGTFTSSATFRMLIEEAAREAFINDLVTAREGRFHLVIYRNSNLEWLGPITVDQVRIDDQYFPYTLSIFAIDGISRLNEIEYKDPATGLKYSGRQTPLEHFYNIIDILDLQGVVTMPTTTFKTNFNWYADSFTLTANALTQFTIDHDVFIKKDNEGNEVILSAFDVLQMLCKGLMGSFYFADGHWWFMQPAEYTGTTQTVYSYNSSGAQSGLNSGTSFDRAIDYSAPTGRRKVAGGSWSYLRPIKKVIVDYRHLSSNNRAQGVQFNFFNNGSLVTLPQEVNVSATGESQVALRINIREKTDGLDFAALGLTVYPPHRYKYEATVKIGGHYLKREVTGNIHGLIEGETAWSTLVSKVTFYGPLHTSFNDGQDQVFNLALTSPPLDAAMDGNNIQYTVDEVGIIDVNGNEVTTNASQRIQWFDWSTVLNSVVVEKEGTGNNPSNDILRFEAEDSTDGNTGIYKLETHFGDGPQNFSTSRLLDGSVNTENWGVGTLSGTDAVSMLLAKEVLALRQTAAKMYQGVYLASDFHIYNRAVDLTEAYLPIRATWSAKDDQWSGDFVKMQGAVITYTTYGPYTPGNGNSGGPGRRTDIAGISAEPSLPDTTTPPPSGLVYNSNELQSPTTLSGGVAGGSTDPNIPITPVGYSFTKQGDQVRITNLVTGFNEVFTVAATPMPNATSLDLVGTTSEDFPPGSFVQIEPVSVIDKGFSEIVWEMDGTVYAVTGGSLPVLATVGEEEMRRRIKVTRSGIRFFYSLTNRPNGFITLAGPDRIQFYQNCRKETVFVEVVP